METFTTALPLAFYLIESPKKQLTRHPNGFKVMGTIQKRHVQ
jgi:hypothetical protein